MGNPVNPVNPVYNKKGPRQLPDALPRLQPPQGREVDAIRKRFCYNKSHEAIPFPPCHFVLSPVVFAALWLGIRPNDSIRKIRNRRSDYF